MPFILVTFLATGFTALVWAEEDTSLNLCDGSDRWIPAHGWMSLALSAEAGQQDIKYTEAGSVVFQSSLSDECLVDGSVDMPPKHCTYYYKFNQTGSAALEFYERIDLVFPGRMKGIAWAVSDEIHDHGSPHIYSRIDVPGLPTSVVDQTRKDEDDWHFCMEMGTESK